MERIQKSEYLFNINNEEFILYTENGKPRVRTKISDTPCDVKPTIRRYIQNLNLLIPLTRKNKNGELVDLTTNELVGKFLLYYGFSKKDIIYNGNKLGNKNFNDDKRNKSSFNIRFSSNEYHEPRFEFGALVGFKPYSKVFSSPDINLLRDKLFGLISDETSVEVTKELFMTSNNKFTSKGYNALIRSKVKNKTGIYIIENTSAKEILYIGMAGRIKIDEFVNHSILDRLQRSRGKDKKELNKNGKPKDISTGLYLANFIREYNVESLKIHCFYNAKDIPPAYLESICLFAFYSENHCIPRLNKEF